MKRRYYVLSVLSLPMLALSGCFTGIESTPRITEKDVLKQNALESVEEKFASALTQDSFSVWKPGKRLVVVDDRISLLFSGENMPEAGDTILYSGFTEIPSVTGDSVTVLNFSPVAGKGTDVWEYQADSSAKGLAGRSSFEIPFTVDLALVDKAVDLLKGNRYYILTPLWVDGAGGSASGLRYVPVTVTDVNVGNSLYPLRVEFETDNGLKSGVMMTVGKDQRSTRNFESIFAFDDPHLRYPSISDSIWDLIIKGDVVSGMTRDECRLSLGSPRDVRKSQNGSSYFEIWAFDNGSYLIFEDGLLSDYRK